MSDSPPPFWEQCYLKGRLGALKTMHEVDKWSFCLFSQHGLPRLFQTLDIKCWRRSRVQHWATFRAVWVRCRISPPPAPFFSEPLSGRKAGPITESNWLWLCNRTPLSYWPIFFSLNRHALSLLKPNSFSSWTRERERAETWQFGFFSMGFWKEAAGVSSGFNYWVRPHPGTRWKVFNRTKGQHVNFNVSLLTLFKPTS